MPTDYQNLVTTLLPYLVKCLCAQIVMLQIPKVSEENYYAKFGYSKKLLEIFVLAYFAH